MLKFSNSVKRKDRMLSRADSRPTITTEQRQLHRRTVSIDGEHTDDDAGIPAMRRRQSALQDSTQRYSVAGAVPNTPERTNAPLLFKAFVSGEQIWLTYDAMFQWMTDIKRGFNADDGPPCKIKNLLNQDLPPELEEETDDPVVEKGFKMLSRRESTPVGIGTPSESSLSPQSISPFGSPRMRDQSPLRGHRRTSSDVDASRNRNFSSKSDSYIVGLKPVDDDATMQHSHSEQHLNKLPVIERYVVERKSSQSEGNSQPVLYTRINKKRSFSANAYSAAMDPDASEDPYSLPDDSCSELIFSTESRDRSRSVPPGSTLTANERPRSGSFPSLEDKSLYSEPIDSLNKSVSAALERPTLDEIDQLDAHGADDASVRKIQNQFYKTYEATLKDAEEVERQIMAKEKKRGFRESVRKKISPHHHADKSKKEGAHGSKETLIDRKLKRFSSVKQLSVETISAPIPVDSSLSIQSIKLPALPPEPVKPGVGYEEEALEDIYSMPELPGAESGSKRGNSPISFLLKKKPQHNTLLWGGFAKDNRNWDMKTSEVPATPPLPARSLHAEKFLIKVYLVQGDINTIRYTDGTGVKSMIDAVSRRVSPQGLPCIGSFGLRLVDQQSGDFYWLPPNFTMQEVKEHFSFLQPIEQRRYELRVRYLPKTMKEFFEKDRSSFFYYYAQVYSEYVNAIADKLEQETAIKLGVLEIRRQFKNTKPNVFEKKSNFELLEKDVGLRKFFAESLIDMLKTKKELRKTIGREFKAIGNLDEEDCVFHFFAILRKISRFDEEIYRCSLGSGWTFSVEIVIGPQVGVAYWTDNGSKPTPLADFEQITSISTETSIDPNKSGILQLKIHAIHEPLIITTKSIHVADNMADLIDGYCRLAKNTEQSFIVRQQKKRELPTLPSANDETKTVGPESIISSIDEEGYGTFESGEGM